MTLVVFCMWWLVAVPTVRGFLRGTLFDAPCLSSLPEDYGRSKRNRKEQKVGADGGSLSYDVEAAETAVSRTETE